MCVLYREKNCFPFCPPEVFLTIERGECCLCFICFLASFCRNDAGLRLRNSFMEFALDGAWVIEY